MIEWRNTLANTGFGSGGIMKALRVLLLSSLLISATALSALSADLPATGIDDRIGLEVTVYNNNVGMIKEVRRVRLEKGLHEMKFSGVPSQIIPASISVRPRSGQSGFSVLEQTYEYDLLSPRRLLDRYVGKKVKLYTKNPYTDKEDVVEALIVANNEGGPVFKIGNDVTFGHPGRIIFPEIPEDLISKPALVWLADSKAAGLGQIEAFYLTNGITWQADYILLLNSKESAADLSAWVTVTNKSGGHYKDAKLKLVAGDVRRVATDSLMRRSTMALAAEAAPAPSQFKEEALFEYHAYSLDRNTTIEENETRQISLFYAKQVPVRKEYIYRGQPHYLQSRFPEAVTKDKVAVFVEFTNRKDGDPGTPLPKGTVRVYKEDSAGSPQFVGEDGIEHTPIGEKVRLRTGNAFDITASRKQLSWERVDKNTFEAAFEITLRNRKAEDIVVKVVELLPGDWRILESSLPHKKEDAFTASFEVPVRKDGEAKLTYKARVRN